MNLLFQQVNLFHKLQILKWGWFFLDNLGDRSLISLNTFLGNSQFPQDYITQRKFSPLFAVAWRTWAGCLAGETHLEVFISIVAANSANFEDKYLFWVTNYYLKYKLKYLENVCRYFFNTFVFLWSEHILD